MPEMIINHDKHLTQFSPDAERNVLVHSSMHYTVSKTLKKRCCMPLHRFVLGAGFEIFCESRPFRRSDLKTLDVNVNTCNPGSNK